MESDFYKLWDIAINKDSCLRLTVEYSESCYWSICIEQSQPRSLIAQLFCSQDCNRKLVYAEAYAWLVDYLRDTYGGY